MLKFENNPQIPINLSKIKFPWTARALHPHYLYMLLFSLPASLCQSSTSTAQAKPSPKQFLSFTNMSTQANQVITCKG